MNVVTRVLILPRAEKQLRKVPRHIQEVLRYWALSVEQQGIADVRKLSGYHDEPLSGDRKGQRSIRLNRAYRAIYIEMDESIELCVIEVNEHDY